MARTIFTRVQRPPNIATGETPRPYGDTRCTAYNPPNLPTWQNGGTAMLPCRNTSGKTGGIDGIPACLGLHDTQPPTHGVGMMAWRSLALEFCTLPRMG